MMNNGFTLDDIRTNRYGRKRNVFFNEINNLVTIDMQNEGYYRVIGEDDDMAFDLDGGPFIHIKNDIIIDGLSYPIESFEFGNLIIINLKDI